MGTSDKNILGEFVRKFFRDNHNTLLAVTLSVLLAFSTLSSVSIYAQEQGTNSTSSDSSDNNATSSVNESQNVTGTYNSTQTDSENTDTTSSVIEDSIRNSTLTSESLGNKTQGVPQPIQNATLEIVEAPWEIPELVLPSSDPPQASSVLANRGRYYELWDNQDNSFTIRLGVPVWVYDASQRSYVPHIVKNYGNDTIDVQSGLISWRVNPQEALIFGEDFDDYRATERWVTKVGNVTLSTNFVDQTIVENGVGVFVTNTYAAMHQGNTISIDIVYAIWDGQATERVVKVNGLPKDDYDSISMEREWTDLSADSIVIDDETIDLASNSVTVQESYADVIDIKKDDKLWLRESMERSRDKLGSLTYDDNTIKFAYDKWNSSYNRIQLIDPTVTLNDPTSDGYLRSYPVSGTSCATTPWTGDPINTSHTRMHLSLDYSFWQSTCYRSYAEWDITAIPDGSDVTNTVFKFDIDTPLSNPKTCDYMEMNSRPSTSSWSTIWPDIGDGTVFVSGDSTCQTSSDNKSLDLGSSADADVESQLLADWWAVGLKFGSETRDSSSQYYTSFVTENDAGATPKPTLEITYTPPPGGIFQGDARLESSGEQRSIYSDGTRIWLFHYNNSTITCKYSEDNGMIWYGASCGSTGALADNSYFGVYGEGNTVVLTWANATSVLTKKGIISGASISWSSPVLVMNVNGTNSGQNYLPSFEKVGSTLFLGFNVVSGGSNIGKIYSSSNLGGSWSSSVDLYSSEANPAPVGVARYGVTKAIATYAKYGSNQFEYKLWGGESWNTTASSTIGAGLISSALKTNAFSTSSDGSCVWVGYTPSNAGGYLNATSFCEVEGALKYVHTRLDSGTNSSPSIASTNGSVRLFYIQGGIVKAITNVNSASGTIGPLEPFGSTFVGPSFIHAEKNTSSSSNLSFTPVVWKEGSSPYYVKFGLLEHGLLAKTTVQNSPGLADSYEGQRRVLSNMNGTLFAFYYNGTDIVYKKSFDYGYTWSLDPVSTGTGSMASDSYSWSVAHTIYNGTDQAALLYYKVSGSNTDFYQKTFTVDDSGLALVSTVNTFSAANDTSCNPTGVCAAAAGSSDSNSTLYAVYRWKSAGTWNYRILNSTDGGSSWQTSLTATSVTTSNRFPITLTSLNSTDSGTASRFPMALTKLASGKMLFSYLRYDTPNIYYRVFDGSSWGSEQTITSGTGLSANTVKQVSAASNSTGHAFLAYVTGGTSSILNVVNWTNTGSSPMIETVDNSTSHYLPFMLVMPTDTPAIYTNSGQGEVLRTDKLFGYWIQPYRPYPSILPADNQLAGGIGLFGPDSHVAWKEGTTVREAGVDHFEMVKADDCDHAATVVQRCQGFDTSYGSFWYRAPDIREQVGSCVSGGGGSCFNGDYKVRFPLTDPSGSFRGVNILGNHFWVSSNPTHPGVIHKDTQNMLLIFGEQTVFLNEVLATSLTIHYNIIPYFGVGTTIIIFVTIIPDGYNESV